MTTVSPSESLQAASNAEDGIAARELGIRPLVSNTTVRGRNVQAVLDAARLWMNRCLIADGSVFTDRTLWTGPNADAVYDAFVRNPDAGADDFYTKLKGQMRPATPQAQQLMAEMLWALLLFPAKIKPATKRDPIRDIWALSGEELPLEASLLTDSVLLGVGSGGPGFNNHRWREMVFLVDLTRDLKRRDRAERLRILSDYPTFTQWMREVPQQGHRQFRHMLRFFAFPTLVEPMASNRHRWEILRAYRDIPLSTTREWSDDRLDQEVHKVREQLQRESPDANVSFYESPWWEQWQPDDSEDVDSADHSTSVGAGGYPQASNSASSVHEQPADYAQLNGRQPRNVIFYGPPGTGKTYHLEQLFREYTDEPQGASSETRLEDILSDSTWRPVIVAAMADIGKPVRVPDLRDHPWIRAKARQRGLTPSRIQRTLWPLLQEHSTPSSTTVNLASRRGPYVFDKNDAGEWHLLPNWDAVDEEAAAMVKALRTPSASGERVRRYEVVTFHPSFSYEDFVRGIRPVATDDGQTQFQVVDGVFTRICSRARANPTARYALFIDEINRANIAKVFGELITLIEPSKRATWNDANEVTSGFVVQLPGGDSVSEGKFGVPRNLDIYGSMNTADRSIALLDIALRRRFEFREIGPDYTALPQTVEGVRLAALLERINERLEYLIDRDHQIGHAYLMSVQSLDQLRSVFAHQLIPLLQEYFFDDLGRMAQVLATTGASRFVMSESVRAEALFPNGTSAGAREERMRYWLTPSSSWSSSSFQGLYSGVDRPEPSTGVV